MVRKPSSAVEKQTSGASGRPKKPGSSNPALKAQLAVEEVAPRLPEATVQLNMRVSLEARVTLETLARKRGLTMRAMFEELVRKASDG